MTPYTSLKLMYFLWKMRIVNSLTLVQFAVNSCVQYGTFVVTHTVRQNTDYSNALLSPILELGTAYQYVWHAQGVMERQQRIATLATLMASSTVMLDMDFASNAAMGSLHVAVNAYIKSLIENGNTPFILSYRVGQERFLFLIVGSLVILK